MREVVKSIFCAHRMLSVQIEEDVKNVRGFSFCAILKNKVYFHQASLFTEKSAAAGAKPRGRLQQRSDYYGRKSG